MTNSNNPNSKYQLLKQKKLDLEKRLNEKYNQLQQVCREEAQIIGVYPVDFGSTDPSSQNNTLRRRVGTSFKLSENLLSGGSEDDINRLLLEKQIQLQICEASLRLASDQTLSKSAVRTHKQNYESAQQKLLAINQNISKLRKLQNAKPIQQTQDDINIHKSPDSTSPHVLNMVDRRNLTKSNSVTNSPSTSHKQPFTTPQPRTRHDSIGTNRSTTDYEIGKMSPISPTTGYQSFNQNYQQQLQHLSPHYHYSSAATISGYTQSRKSPSLSYSARPTPQHFHHNTMPLRQLNSSPMRQIVDTNGNNDSYFNYEPPSRPESSLVDRIESVQQAPGGYWLSMANNERVWFPLDNKYSSLDRRNLAKKHLGHQAKSTSMGNIDFAVDSDAISVTSGSSEQKRREKTWQETSLDEPEPIPPRAPVPMMMMMMMPQSPMKNVYKSAYDESSDIENANIPPKLAPRAAKLVRAPSLEPVTAYHMATAVVPEIIPERPSSVLIPQMIPISPTNSLYSPDSPNVTVVQQGKIQPYKEEEKPFEMADFYKYSTKFRQKQAANQQNNNSKSG